MARKKKNKEQTLEIKNTSYFSYSGKVNIVTKDKYGNIIQNITKHNFGTNELFKFLLTCLSGTFIINDVPHYIYLIAKNDPASETTDYNFVTAVEYPVTISTVTDNEDGSSSVTYQASIPIYGERSFDGLVLYSTNNSRNIDTTQPLNADTYNAKYSMIVVFDETINLDIETTLIITWQLSIQDKGDSE